ncbi:MAG: GEVED domain-containing protein [Bacteroidia bacterium]
MILKRVKFVLSTLLVLFIQFLSAQVTIPAGNLHSGGMTNAVWRKPLGSFFGYERSALLFRQSEIGTLGQINSIAFYCDTSIHSPGKTPVKVYMSEQTDSVFLANTTVATEESGMQLVFNDTLQGSAFVSGQWTVITLSTPFLKLTSRPLKIVIETNAGGAGNENSLSKSFYHFSSGYNNFQYWSSDNTPPTNQGIRSLMRPNIQIGITTVSACSGTPIAGTTVSSLDTTCSAVSLSLTGNSAATGLTYQWQDSTAGGAWISVPYANFSTFNTSVTADTWFRCKVSCSSQSDYSIAKEVALRNYMLCYCTTGLGGACNGTDALFIDSVSITGTQLANGSTGCSANNYIQYPAQNGTCAQLANGQSYLLHTVFGGNVVAAAWVDYNQNGQFEKSEYLKICNTALADSDYVRTLSVPATAKNGLTLMRIRTRAAGNANDSADACTNFASGETEDYFIGINYNVGIKQTQLAVSDRSLLVYPNPASGTLFATLNFAVNEQITYGLYAVNGTLTSEIKTQQNTSAQSIDISQFEPGVYFLKASGKDFSLVKKVVISR